MRKSFRRIGLLDHMGMGNMGDAAILESFITNIKSRLPGAALVAFSLHPDDTKKRHKLDCYPITWCYPQWNDSEPSVTSAAAPGLKSRLKQYFKTSRLFYSWAKPLHDGIQELRHLIRSFRVVRSLDVLVLSGGGQLCDLHPGLPYNVFKFCLLAKLSNTPVFIVGVGADRLLYPSSRFFAKWSVRLAKYVSLRSMESQALIRELGVKETVRVCPDPAYALDVREYITSNRSDSLTGAEARALLRPFGCVVDYQENVTAPSSSRLMPTVGLNPMGFCDPRRWPRKDGAVYSHYLDKVEAFSLWLLNQGYRVEIFTSDILVDVYAIEDLTKRLSRSASPEARSRLVVHPVLTLEELFTQISTLDFIVTSKFHGVIFSHLSGKPVIALSYLAKIDDLMRTVGHGEYCLDIEHFELSTLLEKFKSLVDNADHLRKLFRTTAATYADELHGQYDNLFGGRGTAALGRIADVNENRLRETALSRKQAEVLPRQLSN
jgi:polysaccharide pyruvyl transferase WcaK-like protein